MKLIQIEELEIGDEIVISCQSFFKYLRILRKPELNKHGIYKSVKCSSVRSSTSRQYKDYKGVIQTYHVHKWEFGSDDHNFTQYLDLAHRQLLLIKTKEK